MSDTTIQLLFAIVCTGLLVYASTRPAVSELHFQQMMLRIQLLEVEQKSLLKEVSDLRNLLSLLASDPNIPLASKSIIFDKIMPKNADAINLVARGLLREALDSLQNTDDVVMLKSRLSRLEASEVRGEDMALARARLAHDLLTYIGTQKNSPAN